MIYDLRDIAWTWGEKNMPDSALHYYNKAMRLATEQKNEDMKATVGTQIAALYEKKGMTNIAWRYLRPAICYADPFDESAVRILAARLYLIENKKDSAKDCYERLTTVGSIYAKYTAHAWLADYNTSQGNAEDALFHVRKSKQYADSISNHEAIQAVNMEVAMFNHDRLEKMLGDKENKPIRNIAILVAIIIVGLLISYKSFQKYKKRKSISLIGIPSDAELEQEIKDASMERLKETEIYKKS